MPGIGCHAGEERPQLLERVRLELGEVGIHPVRADTNSLVPGAVVAVVLYEPFFGDLSVPDRTFQPEP